MVVAMLLGADKWLGCWCLMDAATAAVVSEWVGRASRLSSARVAPSLRLTVAVWSLEGVQVVGEPSCM